MKWCPEPSHSAWRASSFVTSYPPSPLIAPHMESDPTHVSQQIDFY